MQRLAKLKVMALSVLLVGMTGSIGAQAPTPPLPAPKPQPVDPLGPVTPKPAPLAKAVISRGNGDVVPERWPVGFALELSAVRSVKGDRSESVKWFIDPPLIDEYAIKRTDGTVTISSDEALLVTIRLVVAKGDTVDGDVKQIQLYYRKPTPPVPQPDVPTPPPVPTPVPVPQPDVPTPPAPPPGPVLLGDAKVAYDLVTSKVQLTPSRKAVLLEIANNFMTVASEVSMGAAGNPDYAHMKDVKKVTGRLTELNKSIMVESDPEVPAWKPFFSGVNNWLDDMKAKGGLQDATAYGTVFGNIAKGLKAASK